MLELWLWLRDNEPWILVKKKEVVYFFLKNLSNILILKSKDSDQATLEQYRIIMI